MFKSSQINWLIRIQIDFLSLFIYCRVTWWPARSRPAPWSGSRRFSCRGWSCRCQWRGWPSPCSWSRTRCDSSPGESNMWIFESVVRGQPNNLPHRPGAPCRGGGRCPPPWRWRCPRCRERSRARCRGQTAAGWRGPAAPAALMSRMD